MIPFFDYLDNRAFIRNDNYDFEPDQLINEKEFYRLFDQEKSIFLYADGCIRSGYIKDILNYLGYEKVFVIGGYFEYDGEYKVLGDGFYTFGDSFSNSLFDSETELTFYIYGTYNMDRKISDIRFDIIDNENVTLRSPNYSESIDYNLLLENLEDFILEDRVTFKELSIAIDSKESNGYVFLLDYDEDILDNLIKLIQPLVPK
jgi:hypothetical protein